MKKIGTTKKISLSLTDYEWQVLDRFMLETEMNMSQSIRHLLDFKAAENQVELISHTVTKKNIHQIQDLDYFREQFSKALLIKNLNDRDLFLVNLMENMQRTFSIPTLSSSKFNSSYPDVISLYRSISYARSI
ncbi:hypothetical protein BLD48_10340 [Exiguobacterium sp. KRL4]|uniref:hypothetical protein n=1 Tax=Exiguobacterium sp. KRL4 TaxID=1914536 RepID=UPI0008F85E1D|nr:hypothetical protein [Exiguobacterium sp. KRL4]OIN66533.1 hypothetical protein BLD48_10340 [Exiguobacterium sp. KRL4]